MHRHLAAFSLHHSFRTSLSKMLGRVSCHRYNSYLLGAGGGRDLDQGYLSVSSEVQYALAIQGRSLPTLLAVPRSDFFTLFPNPSCRPLSPMLLVAPAPPSRSWRRFPFLFITDSWTLDKLCSGLQQFHSTSLSVAFHQIKSVVASLPFLVSFLRF